MMVKLSLVDQSVFCAYDADIIFPVPGGWGKKGCNIYQFKEGKEGHVAGCAFNSVENRSAKENCSKILP